MIDNKFICLTRRTDVITVSVATAKSKYVTSLLASCWIAHAHDILDQPEYLTWSFLLVDFQMVYENFPTRADQNKCLQFLWDNQSKKLGKTTDCGDH
jgi:hypothetical protein